MNVAQSKGDAGSGEVADWTDRSVLTGSAARARRVSRKESVMSGPSPFAGIPVDLKVAIERRHGGVATFSGTVSVSEVWEGKTAWNGVVYVFDLSGTPKATRAYAWSEPIAGSDNARVFTVLHIPPAISALEAVRASVVKRHHHAVSTFSEKSVERALANWPCRK